MKGKALLWATWILPAVAFAQEGGGTTGHVDAYYVQDANIEVRSSFGDADVDGDGFGAKGLLHLTDQYMVTGEYQSIGYEGGVEDRSDMRLGAGFGSAARALLAEYVSIEDSDGFGIHGRASGSFGIPRLSLYGQAGYVDIKDEERFYGFEFSVGGSYALLDLAGGTLGALVDYRLTNLEGEEGDTKLKLRDLRLGVRFMFGGASVMPDEPDEDVGVAPVDEGYGEAPAEEEPVGMEPAYEEPAYEEPVE